MQNRVKYLAIILVFLFISPSFGENNNILVEGKGFKNLVIGELKSEDVIKILGNPDSIQETPKEWSRNYIYSKLGLKINFHNDTLNTINTLPTFDGKTSKGISLISSLEDIEAAYGQPVVAPKKTKEDAKVWTYDGVIFWLKRSLFFNKFQGIDSIVIYK